jgi:hypothetical protein
MPLTRRLLVAALAFVILSLSPLESFAGPLQMALDKYPPDWLTRNYSRPRQTQLGMSCGGKLLLGLGIGAGIGLAMVTMSRADVPREAALGVPLVFGAFGTAAAYNTCR